jgi:hypothetical protein
LKNNEDLFIVWIDQAEAIISEKVDLANVSDYVILNLELNKSNRASHNHS